MNSNRLLQISFGLILSLAFSNCQNSAHTEIENLSYQIAYESCDEVSLVTSGIVGGLLSGLTNLATDGLISSVNSGSLGAVPEYWCDCFTYYAIQDLSQHFTLEELTEIRDDKIKKFMVLEKIIELRQVEIQQCIESGSQEIAKDYYEFSKDLDSKFK